MAVIAQMKLTSWIFYLFFGFASAGGVMIVIITEVRDSPGWVQSIGFLIIEIGLGVILVERVVQWLLRRTLQEENLERAGPFLEYFKTSLGRHSASMEDFVAMVYDAEVREQQLQNLQQTVSRHYAAKKGRPFQPARFMLPLLEADEAELNRISAKHRSPAAAAARRVLEPYADSGLPEAFHRSALSLANALPHRGSRCLSAFVQGLQDLLEARDREKSYISRKADLERATLRTAMNVFYYLRGLRFVMDEIEKEFIDFSRPSPAHTERASGLAKP